MEVIIKGIVLSATIARPSFKYMPENEIPPGPYDYELKDAVHGVERYLRSKAKTIAMSIGILPGLEDGIISPGNVLKAYNYSGSLVIQSIHHRPDFIDHIVQVASENERRIDEIFEEVISHSGFSSKWKEYGKPHITGRFINFAALPGYHGEAVRGQGKGSAF